MAVLTFCLGVFTNAVSGLSALETLQLTIVASLLVFGIVVADVSAAFFHIVESVIPTSLIALQRFKGDLLESKLRFMKLMQHRDKTEPVRRFYEEIVSGGALDKMGGCVSEHLVFREGETLRPAGISGMRDHIESLRHTYPDLVVRVVRQYVADDVVVSEVSMSGTFEKMDVPPTLCSLAIAPGKASEVISPEFKEAGHTIRLVSCDAHDTAALTFGFDEAAAAIKAATEELAKASHKLAEQLYQQQAPNGGAQAPGAGPHPGAGAAQGNNNDDVVDADFTEVKK